MQIATGADLSFENIIAPTALRLLEGADTGMVMDIGCGAGDLTKRLAGIAAKVIAIDPSARSIAVAEQTCRGQSNIRFASTTLEDSLSTEGFVSAAIACMTLMSTPDLSVFVHSLSALLRPGAVFAAIICHPWFWPRYWRYQDAPWFHYRDEIFIEAPFAISNETTSVITTHIHRPLQQYVDTFMRAGFVLDVLREPMPSPEVDGLYPESWAYPRFLGLKWRFAPRDFQLDSL